MFYKNLLDEVALALDGLIWQIMFEVGPSECHSWKWFKECYGYKWVNQFIPLALKEKQVVLLIYL